jgi:peptidoglycan/LPS O-acetylase OafA/YrhL
MTTDSIKRWEVQSSTGKHFDVLDGLRGVAILMVVAYHGFYTNPGAGALMRLIGGVFGTGWMGVPIFFVLSGFLISYPFFRGRAADKRFWYQQGYTRRRVGKIIPPFYLSIVIFTLYYFLRFSNSAYLHAAWQWAVGLPNFIQPAADFRASYWSLIVEAHFYVILPLLFLFTRGLKPRPTAALLFLILFVAPLAARLFTWPEAPNKKLVQFLMTRFPCDLDFFAWGVLFSGVFVSLSSIRDKLRVLSLFGYAGLILLMVSIGFWTRWVPLFNLVDHPTRWSVEVFHLLPAASAFLMLFFVFDPNCIGSRILGHSSLRFIGIVSYEWFLFHVPVVSLFYEMFGKTHGNLILYIGKTALPLALTFGFSVIVYRYFSLPLMNRIRGSTLRGTKQPPATTLDNPPDNSAKFSAPTLKQ